MESVKIFRKILRNILENRKYICLYHLELSISARLPVDLEPGYLASLMSLDDRSLHHQGPGPVAALLWLHSRSRFKTYISQCLGSVNFLGPVRALVGPCWDHVLPLFVSKPDRALKFPRLGLPYMYIVWIHFVTISGSYLDHDRTVFGLPLLPTS